jgi:Protein of unknown function (DUF3592)
VPGFIQRLLGIACAAFGVAVFLGQAKLVVGSVQSRNWPSTVGLVLSSQVVSSTSGRRWHKPEVQYRYTVQGNAYLGSQVWSVPHGATLEATAQEVVAANSVTPAVSVLKPGLVWEPVIGCLLALVATLAGGLIARDANVRKVAQRVA